MKIYTLYNDEGGQIVYDFSLRVLLLLLLFLLRQSSWKRLTHTPANNTQRAITVTFVYNSQTNLTFSSRTPPNALVMTKPGDFSCPQLRPFVRMDDTSTNLPTPAFTHASISAIVPTLSTAWA